MSDQRIKIENAIACAFGIGWNVQHDGVIKSSQLYIDKRNDCIHRYADEIESLIRSHTAPGDLIGAVKRLLNNSYIMIGGGVSCNESDVEEVRSALSAQEPKVCVWAKVDGGIFKMGCCGREWSHEDHDTPSEAGEIYCYRCGLPIEVKESDVRQGGKG